MAKNDLKLFAGSSSANVMTQAEYEAHQALVNGFSTGVAQSKQLNKVWRQSSFAAAMIGLFTSLNANEDVLDDGNVEAFEEKFEKAIREVINQRMNQRSAWQPVISLTVTVPPASPVVGDAYIIPVGATGVWLGLSQKLAEWNGTSWNIIVTKDGHGVGLPDGRVFERVSGTYIEKLALDAQSGKWTYADVAGNANALTAILAPAPVSYTPGLQINIKIATTNTGAATINVNGLGAKSIVDRTGTALSAGDLVAAEIVSLVYDGTRFRTIGKSEGSNQLISSAGWIKLPGGLIMQWGAFSGVTGSAQSGNGVYESDAFVVNWPLAFPNACLQVVTGCGTDVAGAGLQEQTWLSAPSRLSATGRVACRLLGATLSGSYIVFGY